MSKILRLGGQAIRFALVGFASNIVLYIIYVVVTSNGLGHKAAMTLIFATGVLQTFILNKQWTFGDQRRSRAAFIKYVVIYGVAYAINFGALLWFVDYLGFPHEVIQGVIILVVALLLFISQKYWVFGGVRSRH